MKIKVKPRTAMIIYVIAIYITLVSIIQGFLNPELTEMQRFLLIPKNMIWIFE